MSSSLVISYRPAHSSRALGKDDVNPVAIGETVGGEPASGEAPVTSVEGAASAGAGMAVPI
jgi:hypothetical protein